MIYLSPAQDAEPGKSVYRFDTEGLAPETALKVFVWEDFAGANPLCPAQPAETGG
jgi:hypothetical protein